MKRLLISAAVLFAFALTASANAQQGTCPGGHCGGYGWGEWDDFDMAIHAEIDLLDTPAFEMDGTQTGFAPSSSVKHQYFKYDGAVWGHANGGRDDSLYTHENGYAAHENSRVKGEVSMTYRLPDDMFGEPGHKYRNKSDAFKAFAEHGSLSIRFRQMYVEMNNGNKDGLPSVTFDKEETMINRDAGTFSGSMRGRVGERGTMSGSFYGPNGETLGGTWTHQYRGGPSIEAVFTADKR